VPAMRFSIWPATTRPWSEILEITRHCEATGWDGVWVADHFMPNSGDTSPEDGPMLECWSLLAALAATTDTLRLGPLVTSVTYRHPAVLANIAAAVEQISSGRLVLGVGAGWQLNEHAAYGIELSSVRERIDRFEEAIQVVQGLLREQRTTFSGEYFTVTDAPNDPKPGSPLPLLIGAKGEKRTMRIAARYADEWNAWTTPDEMRHKRAVLHRHCEDLGRDPSEITISTQALLFLSKDEGWLAKRRETPTGRPEIIGTPDEVADIVAAYRDAGVDELIIPDWTMGPVERARDTYDLFRAEVIGAL
jgi:F420-dependent oxidoreductase-like protein